MTAGTNDRVAELRDRVLAIVGGWEGVEPVTMFGCPSFTADETLFCVVSEQGVSLTRLPEADRAALADVVPIAPFDAGGRSVSGWATVAPDDLPDDERLAPFLRASYEAALEEAAR